MQLLCFSGSCLDKAPFASSKPGTAIVEANPIAA